MKLLNVCGYSKSGKTTTIEAIIKELCNRGFSVASIKEIHYEQFAMDTEGTNTMRHKQAGSQLVSARGYYETDILFPYKLSLEELLEHYHDNYDYLVMEGVSDANVPTILVGHTLKELDARWNSTVFAVSGITATLAEEYRAVPCIDATQNIGALVDLLEIKTYDRLPNFPKECCSACGFSCAELGVEIMNGRKKRADCVLTNAELTLTIAGKPVQMVPFVQKVLKNTILAVASELKGYAQGMELEVKISGDRFSLQKK